MEERQYGYPKKMTVQGPIPTHIRCENLSTPHQPEPIGRQNGEGNPNTAEPHGNIFEKQQKLARIHQHLQKLMANSKVIKTPLAILNEFCVSINGQVNEEIESAGSVHEPKYECILQARFMDQPFQASGFATTKKDSKQAAAKTLLMQVGYLESKMQYTPTSPKTPCQEASVASNFDPDVEGNPVGDLNNWVMQRRCLAVIYEDLPKEAYGIFRVKCRLTQQSSEFGVQDSAAEIGTGPNKKHAKRVAAQKILEKVRTISQEGDELSRNFAAFSVSASSKSKGGSVASVKKSKDVTDSYTKPLTEVMKWILLLKGEKIQRLLALSSQELYEIDQMTFLTELSTEQHLSPQYFDFPPHLDDDYKAVITLLIDKGRQVFMGTGKKVHDARQHAAHQALDFFKLATRCKIYGMS